jgi:hypothetical protein
MYLHFPQGLAEEYEADFNKARAAAEPDSAGGAPEQESKAHQDIKALFQVGGVGWLCVWWFGGGTQVYYDTMQICCTRAPHFNYIRECLELGEVRCYTCLLSAYVW